MVDPRGTSASEVGSDALCGKGVRQPTAETQEYQADTGKSAAEARGHADTSKSAAEAPEGHPDTRKSAAEAQGHADTRKSPAEAPEAHAEPPEGHADARKSPAEALEGHADTRKSAAEALEGHADTRKSAAEALEGHADTRKSAAEALEGHADADMPDPVTQTATEAQDAGTSAVMGTSEEKAARIAAVREALNRPHSFQLQNTECKPGESEEDRDARLAHNLYMRYLRSLKSD